MVSEPRKIVLTSLFVGAVAIAAYISQSNKNWLSTDELGLERDNASAHYTRGDMVTGSVRSGPVVARSDSAEAIAGDLRAARNSLQRNDLVAAQAQLDVVRSAHGDDGQVLALQREVAAREEQARTRQSLRMGRSGRSKGRNRRDPQHRLPGKQATPIEAMSRHAITRTLRLPVTRRPGVLRKPKQPLLAAGKHSERKSERHWRTCCRELVIFLFRLRGRGSRTVTSASAASPPTQATLAPPPGPSTPS